MLSNSKAREELERLAWAWVDKIKDSDTDIITEENLNSSYRLFFPVHSTPEWKCKKNCRSNPRCYCGLGEAQWQLEVSPGKEGATVNGAVNEDEEDDMSLERRLTGMPVGLKNLGNTCYVNSFLQIWFHNVPFREALYKWDPGRDPLESENETLLEAENYRPKGKVASLQALFAMMDFTNRRAVDPNDLVLKLGLDPQVQQDAAEFSKLFISLLESSLKNQINDEVRSIVQSQFRGELAYVTSCCNCERESKSPSFFYELDLPLQGQKTLLSCLDDFLKEEKLEGDNQYYCNGCESKQDATRCVRLSQLPPVLNLQLNRFIFDMQTGRKKKLNSFVHFPEVLEMASFLRQPSSDTNTFHLTGVLMHVGAEANHGHYIAHIQEAATGQWFKFSDAHVEKLQGRNTELGSEVDPMLNGNSNHHNGSNGHQHLANGFGGAKRMVNGSAKFIKNGKGMQNSNNAYMLVYTSVSALNDIRSKSKEYSSPNSNEPSGSTPSSRKAAALATSVAASAAAKKKLESSAAIKLENGPLPFYLKAFIQADRRLLEDELQEHILMKQTKHKEQVSLKSKMRSIYKRLPPAEESSSDTSSGTETSSSKYTFLPMDWLARYFQNPASPPPIDMTPCMCVHGNLDLNKVQDVKAVDADLAEELYRETTKDPPDPDQPVAPRLTHEKLCELCVRNRCRSMKLARSLSVDHKYIQDLLKIPLPNTTTPHINGEIKEPMSPPPSEEKQFWVGKNTLKKWRALARETLDEKMRIEAVRYLAEMKKKSRASIVEVTSKLSKVGTNVIVPKKANAEAITNGNGTVNGDDHDDDIIEITPKKDPATSNNGFQVPNGIALNPDQDYFNSDIICYHGNLCIQEAKRRLVCWEVWKKFQSYFPDARAFPKSTKPCNFCMENDDKTRKAIEYKKELANSQKNALSDIFNEKNRPSWAKEKTDRVYLVPRAFILEWRMFIRSPQIHEAVTLIPNDLLLCEHGGLIYPLDLSTESDYESFMYMVSEEEWSIMKDNFTIDKEVCVSRNKSDKTEFFSTEPPVCDECFEKRCREEEEEQLDYRNVTVYIRRLTSGERPPEQDPTDPDFDYVTDVSGPKRFKTQNGHFIQNGSSCSDFVRRSNRRQKVRGERELTVSSDMLLRDLKVKIMEAFKVAPYDQNLCLNGQYLTDNSKTLGHLRVLPKSLIYLRADEPNPGISAIEPDDGWNMQHPEEGFKGTGLLEGS